jgi:hypothetical protein
VKKKKTSPTGHGGTGELTLSDALILARKHVGGLIAWRRDRSAVCAIADDEVELNSCLAALGIRREDTIVERLKVPDFDIGYGLH